MKSVICAPLRTPIGSFLGTLSTLRAPELGAQTLKAVVHQTGLAPEHIQEVYMGCVLTAGLGQAPARQAAILAGLPKSIPCTTVSKVCGSGLKSVMTADLTIRAGQYEAILAGGMESMSQTPHLVPRMRNGLRMGNGELVDSMIKDGLWDVYNDYHMGVAAELCAKEFQITREAQDNYAIESYKRAQKANQAGLFQAEKIAIEIASKKGSVTHTLDEEIDKVQFEKISQLRPVFDAQGTVTAANASSLSDGAAAMLVCSENFAQKNNLKPLGRIVAQAQAAQAPEWFTTAPAASIEKLLNQASLKVSDIDFWEINEAFSAVALVNQKLLGISPEKLNVRGGAVALGHPIGASGARILATLLHTLKQERGRYGVASLCIGGGEAVSLLVEAL